MTITDITQQKKRPNRYSVFIDGDFAFGIDGVDLLYYKLEIDKVLTTELYEEIINETVFQKAKDKAIRFLSYRARSRKEVVDKLKQSDDMYSEDVIEKVLALLEKYGYIDDYKFATSFYNDKTKLNGFGEVRIKMELKQKGVDNDIINRVLNESEVDPYYLAKSCFDKKYKGKTFEDYKEKKKAFDFMLRKGFSYEIIKKVIEK